MRILPLLIASAVVFYSCDKKESSAEETPEITVSTFDSGNVPGDTVSPSGSTESMAGQNFAPSKAPIATPFPAGTSQSSGEPALNPAHGQPYHRCEIAVGAPLNSATQQNPVPQAVVPPQNPANNTINTTPVFPSPVPVQATNPKAALNPAHGQPNHRCDIAVGAPLS